MINDKPPSTELVSPEAAIIARQAIQIEQLTREYNELVDRFREVSRAIDTIRSMTNRHYSSY